jgi:hypothetical protein
VEDFPVELELGPVECDGLLAVLFFVGELFSSLA